MQLCSLISKKLNFEVSLQKICYFGVWKMLLCWCFYRETLHFLYPFRCCTRELLSIKKLVKDLFNKLAADLGLCNAMVHLFCLTSYLLKLFCTKSSMSTMWAQHQSNVRIIDSHFTYCKSILLSSESVYKAAKIQSKMIGIKIKLEVWFYAEYMQSYLKNFTTPFYRWGSTVSSLHTYYKETVYFFDNSNLPKGMFARFPDIIFWLNANF